MAIGYIRGNRKMGYRVVPILGRGYYKWAVQVINGGQAVSRNEFRTRKEAKEYAIERADRYGISK